MEKLPDRISINYETAHVKVWLGGKHGSAVYFTVAQYGSYEAALRAAIEHERSLPTSVRLGRRKTHTNAHKSNKSKVPGVSSLAIY
ncbi:hypothetical protein [uncultured Endozoicomonas sp.]|uniref:hypothetical protein n=1 Tax=uncultured Endozoicomonas sp. TaxID=432652 RepID=UPI002631EB35|nr:hypothetical protein [uncultured Endozoicomonas sp.]